MLENTLQPAEIELEKAGAKEERRWRGFGLSGQDLDNYVFRIAKEIELAWLNEYSQCQDKTLGFDSYVRVANGVAPYSMNVLLRACEWAIQKRVGSPDPVQKEAGQLVMSHHFIRSGVGGVQRILRESTQISLDENGNLIEHPELPFDVITLLHEVEEKGLQTLLASENLADVIYSPKAFSTALNMYTIGQGPKYFRALTEQLDDYPSDEDLEKKVLDNENQEEMAEAGSKLPERLRLVTNLKFGMTGAEPMSEREIARVLGISQGRVYQLWAKARDRLNSNSTVIKNRRIKHIYDQYSMLPIWTKPFFKDLLFGIG